MEIDKTGSKEGAKLTYIDALRGLAVLGVVLVHVGAKTTTGWLHAFTQLGGKGVQLFYFISAFTLFRSYHSNITTKKLNFFIRRLFRIAPLYYLAILLYGIIIPLSSQKTVSLEGIVLNLTFTHGFSPRYINSVVPGGWSIAVEMSFYLLVPFLISKINSLKKATIFLLCALLFQTICNFILIGIPIGVEQLLWKSFLYWYLPNQMPAFGFGILFYFVTKEMDIEQSLKDNRYFYATALGVLIITLIINFKIIDKEYRNFDFIFEVVFFTIAILVRKYKFRIIDNFVFSHLGTISYSIYLTHFAIIEFLSINSIIVLRTNNSLLYALYCYLIVLLVTIVVAQVTNKYIEVKFQIVGKKLMTLDSLQAIFAVKNKKKSK